MAKQSTDIARNAVCLRLLIDIWPPDCWTLEVIEGADAGLLGHGVYEVDGLAVGRFTAFGDTTDAVAKLINAIDASPLTAYVRAIPGRRPSASGGIGADVAPGNATRGLLVAYEPANTIATPLVSRGFIPAPVRIRDGRERWAVLTDERPRRVSAADLATELDISKATVLEHLRKAEAKLLDPS